MNAGLTTAYWRIYQTSNPAGELVFDCWDGATRSSRTTRVYTDDAWHIFVGVNDQAYNELRIYVDGVLMGTFVPAGIGSMDPGASPSRACASS